MTVNNYSRITRTPEGVWTGTSADWAAAAPTILPLGNVGVDITLGIVKVGNGASPWSALTFVGSGVDYAEYLLNGAVNLRSSIPRSRASSVLSALTAGVMYSTALYLEAGDVVTDLTFKSVAAAVTPTNWWFALYDTQATPALIAQTADQTSAAWSANTAKTIALPSPYTVPTTGIYYASVMVAAGTVPTLIGAGGLIGSNGPIVTGQKYIAQTSGSGLTTTAPATITSGTAAASIPYVIAK